MKRVHLWAPGEGSKVHVPTLRAAALVLMSLAVDGINGRVAGDPVFERVTEGRQWKAPHVLDPKYSSCGDLVHFVLCMLGCRDELLVNRNDDGGDHPWQPGTNLSRLLLKEHAAWCPYVGRVFAPQPGDPVVVTGPDHVLMARNATPTSIASTDYGQWDPKLNLPAGFEKVRARVGNSLGGRQLLGYLSLELVEFEESATVPDDFPLGVLDESPYQERGGPRLT